MIFGLLQIDFGDNECAMTMLTRHGSRSRSLSLAHDLNAVSLLCNLVYEVLDACYM